ncbi:MAG: hypothetical protein L0H96_23665 [Humibacillus sp.]|nr:hypothetical protein [Humibacillus sp.]MDN5779885.1 hypothetical protein [Humibacillus sp.]
MTATDSTPASPSADVETPAPDLSSLMLWLSQHDAEVDLELACAEHPSPSRGPRGCEVVRLPCCAADLPDYSLAELLSYGALRVNFRLDGCRSPSTTEARWAPLVSLLRAVDLGWRVQMIVDVPSGRRREIHDATGMPLLRRRLLMLPDVSTTDLPDSGLPSHERLVAALRRLVRYFDPVLAGADELPGPSLFLRAPDCAACGVCVHSCPQDALSLVATGGNGDPQPGAQSYSLLQSPSRCSGCDGEPACVQACPARTLEVVGHRAWSHLWRDGDEEVVRVATVRCARCRAPFRAEPQRGEGDAQPGREPLCPACSRRRSRPFGTALPPEALERLDPEVVRALGYEPVVRSGRSGPS